MRTEAQDFPANGHSRNGLAGLARFASGAEMPVDLLEAFAAPALHLDPAGLVVRMNRAAEQAFGRPRAAVVGHSFPEMAATLIDQPADGAALRAALAAAARGVRQDLSWHGNGHGFDLSFAPLADGDVLVTACDAGPRLQAEARAREAERLERSLREAEAAADRALRAKIRFLAAASHDLRQPAQALTLFGAVLAERLRNHPELLLVQRLNEATEALRMLLDGLLDVSRLDAGIVVPECQPVDLGELFERLTADYAPRARDRGLRLRCVYPRLLVHSDAALLERILRNLLDNALKYTKQGGVLLGCRRRGTRLRIDVMDSGVGLPADQIDEIFEEFVQLGNVERDRSRGLGLGLAVVKRLARLLDLPVTVASAPGRGARFSLEVPLFVPERPYAPPLRSEEAAGGLAVLIDDDAMVLQSLRLVLELWGWEVLAAPGQDEAVRLLRESGRRPDVIVADYRLRDNRTGVEAVHAIQAAAGSGMPAILLTGDTSPQRIQEARESGFVVLHKPVTPTDLAIGLAQAAQQQEVCA